jgi:hypothetical protein
MRRAFPPAAVATPVPYSTRAANSTFWIFADISATMSFLHSFAARQTKTPLGASTPQYLSA